MNKDEHAEADVLAQLQAGPLFTGLFDRPGEAEAIARLLAKGVIRKFYEGAAGFLGLSKLEII